MARHGMARQGKAGRREATRDDALSARPAAAFTVSVAFSPR
ncbi:hypothetical protein DO71_5968 [Burkholderia pseudomallei]|nr:hypothetical protein DO71_5968 [Burkholderia pseudomallei]